MDKNYIPLSVKVSSMLLDTDDGETYIPIDILVDKKDKYIVEPGNIYVQTEYQSRIGLMNVKDGKFAWKTSSGKGYDKFKKKIEKATKTCIHLNTILKEDNCSSNIHVCYLQIVVMILRTSH